MPETEVSSLGPKDPLEKGMAAHSSVLAWRIPWLEEPGGLQSIESQSLTQLKQISMHACIREKNLKYIYIKESEIYIYVYVYMIELLC